MKNKKNTIQKTYYHEVNETNEITRLKMLIEGMYGSYNIESIEEIASVLFTSKNEVMRLAEENYESDIENLIELSKWFNVSVDYLLGLTDYPNPYPRTNKGE